MKALQLQLLRKVKALFLSCVLLLGFNCREKNDSQIDIQSLNETTVENLYAEGFKIIKTESHAILEIQSPWPKAEKTYPYLLLTKEQAMTSTYNKDEYYGIITIPIERIVVTSTTHIPALELLGVENTLIGFPGTDYISSEKTRARIENNEVRELGKNEGLNTEVLLDLKPDVVVGFGVDSNNKSLETIRKSNIPVVYNGDWVEKSPLAKAEWIKFFGVLYAKEKAADSIFNVIKNDYQNAKLLASNVDKRPTILCGAMHKDIWYLPSSTSPEAQLLNDANVNYLWKNSSGNGSLALNFETVYTKAQDADFWLSPSYYTSYESLEKASEHYTKFKAFNNKTIYTFSHTTGSAGGVTYYELGFARPDLVLKDLIKICHPDLLENYETTFFKPLL